jgi:hypothetical protein
MKMTVFWDISPCSLVEDKDKLQKCGLYFNTYKEKCKRAVIKYEEELIID